MRHFTLPIYGRALDLEVVAYKDIETIVGRVSLDEFKGLAALARFENEQWLKENILAHEQIVREVMLKTPPIVPFKFGTIFQSRFRVEQMLKKYHRRFQDLLAQFTGKYEWGLKLFSHPAVLKRKISRQAPDIARIVSKMKKQSSGKKYFLEKELEAKYKEKMEKKEQAAAENLQNLITPLCAQYVLNRILSRHMPGQDEELITNAALLIEDTAVDMLRQYVNHWNRLHDQEGLAAELSGPWPPYNFVTL